jgi:hypothetical protein
MEDLGAAILVALIVAGISGAFMGFIAGAVLL